MRLTVNEPFGVGDLPEGKYAVIYVKALSEDITQASALRCLSLVGCLTVVSNQA